MHFASHASVCCIFLRLKYNMIIKSNFIDIVIRETYPAQLVMTNQTVEEVADAYTKLGKRIKKLGSKLRAPYMSVSLMALLVIPELILSDKGLFNGKRFEFTDVFVN